MDEHPASGSVPDRVAGSAAADRRVGRRHAAVLGIDVGTSALKALLADERGSIRAVRRGYRLDVGRDGRVELDADRVWRAARSAIRELAAEASAGRSRVVAICAGGSGDEAVWLDDRGRPVAPIPMALDARAEPDGRRLVEAIGAARYMAMTGLPPSGAYPLPRLAWLRRTAPERAGRVRRLLAWPEFLALRLGVEPVAEPTLAARSGAFDIERGAWSEALLAAAGIPIELFPPVAPIGSIVGTIPAAVADALGLPNGVRVVAGGFDQAMATFGAGVVGPGLAHLGAGSWEALTALRPARSAELVPHGFSVGPAIGAPGQWSAMASWPGAVALGWVGALGRLEASSRPRGSSDVRRALAVAGTARDEPTDVLVLPDVERASIAGLRIDVDAPILARAVLEGIAFAAAEHLEALGRSGDVVEEVRITGGGRLDPAWLQLRADVLGVPVVAIEPPETGIAAAAALAWAGAVGDRSAAEHVAALVRPGPAIAPRRDVADRYAPMRARWRELRSALEASGTASSPGR
jgi:xylulokinase